MVCPCFLTLFFPKAAIALPAAPSPFTAAVMLLGIEAAIDDCVKRCDGNAAVFLSHF
jgi:hypothetical protein